MTDRESFWVDSGCSPGMSPEETEDYLRQLRRACRERGNPVFEDALIADARERLSPPRPGPSVARIEAWERERRVRLPSTLREALQVQDGGYVRGTRLLISRLAEMMSLSQGEWDHLWEYEDNRRFGDPDKLIWIGSDEITGGIVLLDGNIGPEPRIIWLWRDLGDELRDEGDQTFDHMILKLRGAAARA